MEHEAITNIMRKSNARNLAEMLSVPANMQRDEQEVQDIRNAREQAMQAQQQALQAQGAGMKAMGKGAQALEVVSG